MQVVNEEIFGVPTPNFAISPSESGYTLQFSADGKHFTAYGDPTPANENLLVSGSVKGLSYKLAGNTSTVYIQY